MASPIGKQGLTVLKDGKRGGVLLGRKHSECNTDGACGIKAVVKGSDKPIEVEANEVVITAPAVNDKDTHLFDGKKLTNRQILSRINQQGGGVSFAEGGPVSDKMQDGGSIPSLFGEGGTIPCPCHHSMANGGEVDSDNLSEYEKDILYHLNAGKLRYRIVRDLKHIAGIIREGYGYITHGKAGKELHLTHKGIQFVRSMPSRVLDIRKFKEGGQIEDEPVTITSTNGEQVELTKAHIDEQYAEHINKFNDDLATTDKEIKRQEELVKHQTRRAGSEEEPAYLTRSKIELHHLKHRRSEIEKKIASGKENYENYLKQWEDAVKEKKAKLGGIADGAYKGIDYQYANPFELNKAIEDLLKHKEPSDLSPDEKMFIASYTGSGGLEKYGATGTGLLDEFYTPDEVVRYMWALAYDNGFNTSGTVLEPACGAGVFIKYAYNKNLVTGYDINPTSAKICSILYPQATIHNESFEKQFIHNNQSTRDKVNQLKKYNLVIGNPPYRAYEGLYAGMGEKNYTKATNYIGYFIFRGLDLLISGGLLVYIVGTSVRSGGVPFLEQQQNSVNKAIAGKAVLVDAYRLPETLFERTEVVTEIIVLRKK